MPRNLLSYGRALVCAFIRGSNMKTFYFCLVAIAAGAPSFAQTTRTRYTEPHGRRGDQGIAIRLGARRRRELVRTRVQATSEQLSSHSTVTISMRRSRRRSSVFHCICITGPYARYRLAACNSAGCTRSPEISVSSLRRFAVGYFKPAQTVIGMRFAADTDLSGDGLDFVAAAPDDLIASSGGGRPGGAIYLFRRNGGTWRERARLEPTIPPFIEGSNVMKVAMSADGNTVALGMPNYFHQQFDEQSGEVFVFRFNGSRWVRTRIAAGSRGQFGRWVGLSDAGDTLAIARGENLNPSLPPRISIYKLVDGVWQGVRAIAGRSGRDGILRPGCAQRRWLDGRGVLRGGSGWNNSRARLYPHAFGNQLDHACRSAVSRCP